MKKLLSKHQILLTLLTLFLIIGLPSILLAVNNPTDNRSRAVASTTLRFSPTSSSASPLPAVVGTSLPLDVYIAPNANFVSFVRLEITYNTLYFEAGPTTFVLEPGSGLNLREGPSYSPGKITVSFDTGFITDNALTTDTKIGSVVLKPSAKTPRKTPATVTFGPQTTILSTGDSDDTQENVLSSSSPAFITISSPPRGKPQR